MLAQLGILVSKTDVYEPEAIDTGVSDVSERIICQGDIFHDVWKEGAELRKSGSLLQLVRDIRCPVVAIHGDYDPHPAEGVRQPLAANIKNFRFKILERCGHTPWIEKHARKQFYQLLDEELKRM